MAKSQAKTNNQDLLTGAVWKKLLIFFLPIAAGTCIQQLYNAADGLIVGRFVGTEALAAVGGSPAQLTAFIVGFFVSLSSGASVIVAQLFGAGKHAEVRKAAGTGIAFCGLTGILIGILGILFAEPMLRLMQTPEDTLKDALLYLRIYFIGTPFILILNMESGILRAVGDSKNPFRYMAIACISNIVLDLCFVLFFDWGVMGVAVATVLAQVINMVLLTWKLFTVKSDYRLEFSLITPLGEHLRQMLSLGVPAGLQATMYSVSNIILQVGVNSLGTIVVASWSMSGKVDGVFWAVSNALGAAITTFIGQNYGAGNKERIRKCVRQGLLLALGMTAVISTTVMIFGRPLTSILTDDKAVIETTYEVLTYFVPYYFTWSLIEVISATLRGQGDVVRPVIITGLGICLFRIIWIFTVFRIFHTLPGISFSYTASWVVTGIAMLIYYLRKQKKENGHSVN